MLFLGLLGGCDLVFRVDHVPGPDGPTGDVWTPPIKISELSFPGFGDHDVSVSADGLAILFSSSRPGGNGGGASGTFDIWESSRADTSAPWDAPRPALGLNTTANDYAHLWPDGLTCFVTRGSSGEIMQATRTTRTTAFSTPREVPELSASTLVDSNPEISADGLQVVVTRAVMAVTARDLYLHWRTSPAEPWQERVLSELNTDVADSDGTLGASGETIYFGSTRGDGVPRIYRATRDEAAVYTNIEPATELDPFNVDATDPFLSADDHTLVWSFNADLYMITR